MRKIDAGDFKRPISLSLAPIQRLGTVLKAVVKAVKVSVAENEYAPGQLKPEEIEAQFEVTKDDSDCKAFKKFWDSLKKCKTLIVPSVLQLTNEIKTTEWYVAILMRKTYMHDVHHPRYVHA